VDYDGVKTINLDGNLYDMSGPLSFEIVKGGLRFII